MKKRRKMKNTATISFFPNQEFFRCTPSCSKRDMNVGTLQRLNKAREIAGIPFVLTSAYRSPAWDKLKGRSGTGAHTLGRAVDIKCTTLRERFIIVSALIQAGFTRIGIAKTYIHADDSPTHSQKLIWLYS